MNRSPRRRPEEAAGHRRPPRRNNARLAGIRPSGNAQQVAANARHNFERYTAMAKDAARGGDTVEAENLYQHAEHYFRVMREQTSQ